ncbi:hypothetical protein DER46DRAFT_583133 [Fusarium sp. MPI-SDFR-AT-0072]|nr:hypothetical protein DER46DRAFT_583133 [Fusarium sp. MPI-SDFR-AT-0072]
MPYVRIIIIILGASTQSSLWFPACIKGKVPYLMISLLNTVFPSSNSSSHGPFRLGPSMVLFLVFSPHQVEQ